MRINGFVLLFVCWVFPLVAWADGQSSSSKGKSQPRVVLCYNPETGEEIEKSAETDGSCPDGYLSYIDTPPVEWVNGAPPPHDRQQDRAETGADAK
ncbi:hypothetical protein STA1M1_31850 [Sinisalibacter aestuarii]|uniref:Uncharacterized protein n=1 Tax=Sinisalibacter aestuarii TaxID=2949426 RepID=A0ABQ5LY39_9RHOB|nr:hypothetical protein STA1M1_31850 [Sinisalibacter aestuarii]